jgi:hypothetical protein
MRRALVILLAAAACLLAAAPALAREIPVTRSDAVVMANLDPKVRAERRIHPDLTPSASVVDGNWEVGYFSGDKEVALAIVDRSTGLVRESWTGYQVAWKMARGYSGSFGHKLNAPYVFLPLCAIFLIGLCDWRRMRKAANLDLLVLLAFGVSHYFFNRAEIGVSVPLQYVPLLYLFARCLWIGFRGRGEPLRPLWPAAWLLVAALFLMGFRVGLNLADSGVIDVGYAGVVGADRLADGNQLYGQFPEDVSQGDTYGPVNYLAYVPFEQAWPWSGSWDDLPAAHGAAVFFDLATFGALLLLGIRIRPGPAGRRLAAILGFGWASYPYTAFVLESNSNDSLVALLLVALLLVLHRPAARGAALALATLTKFAPLVLFPMLATYRPENAESSGADGGPQQPPAAKPGMDVASPAGGAGLGDHPSAERGWWHQSRDRTRGSAAFALAFFTVTLVLLLPTLLGPGLHEFVSRTITYQADRDSPFSIWGQVSGLEPLRWAIVAVTAGLALLVAVRPRRKSLAQVAALAAALLIGLQLAAQHWFYLYIVWFFPLLLVALATISPEPAPSPARSTWPGRRDRSRPPLPSPIRRLRRSRSEPASV